MLKFTELNDGLNSPENVLCVNLLFCTVYTVVQHILTSGAKYSGVLQNVLVVAPYVISSLHSTKSFSFICPSLSSKLYNVHLQCHSI